MDNSEEVDTDNVQTAEATDKSTEEVVNSNGDAHNEISQHEISVSSYQNVQDAVGSVVEEQLILDGAIFLELPVFDEFAKQKATEACYYSDYVYIQDLSFRILLTLKEEKGSFPSYWSSKNHLNFFIECTSDFYAVWSCEVKATIRVCSQKGSKPIEESFEHLFNDRSRTCGCYCISSVEDLLKPYNGYIKDNTVCFESTLKVSNMCTFGDKFGFVYDERNKYESFQDTRQFGFVGLKNQGATCYMNSMLQVMFFTNKLREAVYQMPTNEDENVSDLFTSLQKLFYQLQFSDTTVSTNDLTKAFGWDAAESFVQHDIHEFCRQLFDCIEKKMADTPMKNTLSDLFKGQTRSYVSCIDVVCNSEKLECFYDLQLYLDGSSNVYDSFKKIVKTELLEGNNLYDAGVHKMQRAEKGVQFIKLPPVLHLHLVRFEYSSGSGNKINDRYEFPEELNLNEFVVGSEESDEYTYVLQAVLVHSGNSGFGHYYVYINTKLGEEEPQWICFNDNKVTKCTTKEAIFDNYGGDSSSASAYMLVYIQKNKIDDVLCDIQPVEVSTNPVNIEATQSVSTSKDE